MAVISKVEVVKKVEEPGAFRYSGEEAGYAGLSEALWDRDDEFPIPGEMTWNEATVGTGEMDGMTGIKLENYKNCKRKSKN